MRLAALFLILAILYCISVSHGYTISVYRRSTGGSPHRAWYLCGSTTTCPENVIHNDTGIACGPANFAGIPPWYKDYICLNPNITIVRDVVTYFTIKSASGADWCLKTENIVDTSTSLATSGDGVQGGTVCTPNGLIVYQPLLHENRTFYGCLNDAIVPAPCIFINFENPCTDYNGTVDNSVLHDTDYDCICNAGRSGDKCQYINPCTSSPCQNGGSCSIWNGQYYNCTCPIIYTGTNCETISQSFFFP